MIKNATLSVIIAIFSWNCNALTTMNLNSAMSVMNLNQALTVKLPVMPYAGKDITAKGVGNLRTPIVNSNNIIC